MPELAQPCVLIAVVLQRLGPDSAPTHVHRFGSTFTRCKSDDLEILPDLDSSISTSKSQHDGSPPIAPLSLCFSSSKLTMSLPYRSTTTSALRRPLLPSNLIHPPSRILLRGRHSKSGDLASRLVADNVTRSNAMQRSSEQETLAHQQKKSMEYALKAGMNPLVPSMFILLPGLG